MTQEITLQSFSSAGKIVSCYTMLQSELMTLIIVLNLLGPAHFICILCLRNLLPISRKILCLEITMKQQDLWQMEWWKINYPEIYQMYLPEEKRKYNFGSGV